MIRDWFIQELTSSSNKRRCEEVNGAQVPPN